MTPLRLQRSRVKGARLTSPNGLPVLNCARPGRLGNPFKPGAPGPMGRSPIDSVGAVGFFTAMLSDPQLRTAAGYPSDDEISAMIAGKNLMCWCDLCARHKETGKPLDEHCPDCAPCHVDVLGRVRPSSARGATQ